ncbi:MAG: sigma 54-interacting transcriptional regulator [Vicinamibacterales bacterium]
MPPRASSPNESPRSPEHLLRNGRFAECLSILRSGEGGAGGWNAALRAEALTIIGQTEEAERTARTHTGSTQTVQVRSRCHEILGAIAFDAGAYEVAEEECQKSFQLAQSQHLAHQSARAAIRLILCRSVFRGAAACTELLRTARRAVLQADDVHLIACLHLRAGEIEGRRGLLDLSRRHFDAAARLVAREPSPWLEGQVELDYSALEYVASDFPQALVHATRARGLAERTGDRRTYLAALANVGQLSVLLGELDIAESSLQEVLSSCAPYSALRVAALDSLAQLRLVQKSNDAADALLRAIPETRTVRSWYELATYPTRIRLALKQDAPKAALHLVDSAATAAAERGDSLLGSLFLVLRADSLLHAERFDDAAATLTEAVRQSHQMPLATLAELERVHGKFVARCGDTDAALPHFDRAVRILMTTGHASARADAIETRATVAHREHASAPVALEVDWRGRPEGIGHAARLMEMAAQPELLGRETFALVETTRCAHWIALVAERDKRPQETLLSAGIPPRTLPSRDRRSLVIPLGSLRGRRIDLHLGVVDRLEAEHTVWSIRRLVETARALELAHQAEKERTSLWPADLDLDGDRGIFVAPTMVELLQSARQWAANDWPILITGETGTGKEVLAKEVHRASPRATKAFVPFNCTAVAKDMLDSQLFGYRRGAFTGANEEFDGVIRGAAGATLFLDEIGELGPDVQPKLLRFLESREVHPLGEAQPQVVNVRVIAATNANLEDMVASGRFREDLFYRLNIFRLHVPPLRQRREEIPALVEHFLEKFARELGARPLRLGDEALEYLLLYKWPGNVRQLANEMRRLVATLAPGSTIDADVLAADIRAGRRTVDASMRTVGRNECVIRLDQPLDDAVSELEKLMITSVLSAHNGHLEQAAQRLGISRKGLFLKRRRLQL